MIREVESLAATASLRPLRRALASAPTSAPNVESVETEIAQLTWSVLDGSASSSDRSRLAELVRMQHALRPRG